MVQESLTDTSLTKRGTSYKPPSISQYILIGIIITVLYTILSRLNLLRNTTLIKNTTSALVIVLSIFIFSVITNSFLTATPNYESLTSSIVLMGIVIRIGYMLYTPYNIRTYDVLEPTLDSYGHASYLLTVLVEHHLPLDNRWQHYQQPNFYIVGTIYAKIISTLTGKHDLTSLVESSKVVSCLASCYTLLLLRNIYYKLKLGHKGVFFAIAIPVFLPGLYMMASRVGVDSLATFFTALIIYYTLNWKESVTTKGIANSMEETVKLALAFGLGISTKVSCGILAVPVGAYMLWLLLVNIRKPDFIQYIKKYTIFSLISFPIGLWYVIRNYIKFQQDITYVPAPAIPGERLYIGPEYQSTFDLILGLDINRLFKHPHPTAMGEENLTESLLKTSLFGECKEDLVVNHTLLYILLMTNILIALLLLISIIYNLIRNRTKTTLLTLGIFIYQLMVCIMFTINYPYRGSMDYRYVPLLTFAGSALIGTMIDNISITSRNKLFSAQLAASSNLQPLRLPTISKFTSIKIKLPNFILTSFLTILIIIYAISATAVYVLAEVN